jgi:hypothetical protein
MELECYRCGGNHRRRDCPARKKVPAAAPQPSAGTALPRSEDYDAHMAVISGYVTAWQRGEITTGEKRRGISDENLSFHGPDCRAALLWDGGPGDRTRVSGDGVTLAGHDATPADPIPLAAAIRETMGWTLADREARLRELARLQVAESRRALT